MTRVMIAAGILCAVVYLKLLLPGFAEEFVPLMRQWLSLEQISVTLSKEATTWLLLP